MRPLVSYVDITIDINTRSKALCAFVQLVSEIQQQNGLYNTLAGMVLQCCYCGTFTLVLRRCILHTLRWFSVGIETRGFQYRTIRLRTALGEMLPKPTFLALALLQVWKYQAQEVDPGGAGVINTVVYCRRLTC